MDGMAVLKRLLLSGILVGVVKCDSITNANTLFPEEQIQLTETSLRTLSSNAARQLGFNGSVASIFGFGNGTTALKKQSGDCKTYSGDSLWPSDLLWDVFNLMLSGNEQDSLMQIPPLASVCYTNWGNYDADACSYISTNWHNDSFLHAEHPSSIMSPFYEGSTCMPPSQGSETVNCTLGGYPYYIVNATTVAQIQLAVNMARNLDLRLVIKNTGHDFSGKSSGEGALSIWTHNMKTLEYQPQFEGSTYSGPAVKMGSGVQEYEAYTFANENGVTVVGGEGETVGIAGGYVQGGGHSPLSSVYGLATDSVLAYQVITADGQFVTASDDEHADLFWALRGGGGGTFGVVTSVTVKAWPKIGATVSLFTLSTGDSLSPETFWLAMRAFLSHFVTWADAGAYSYFMIEFLAADSYYFSMKPFFIPNATHGEHTALLQPWFDELAVLNATVVFIDNATYFDNFYDAWEYGFPLEEVGYDAGRVASRLFPRANFQNETLLNATFAALQNLTTNGYSITGFNFKNDLYPSNTANSANPALRDALMHAITASLWADGDPVSTWIEASDTLTYEVMDQLRAVTVGSGAYMNEGDSSEPNWQQSFFGANYDRLLDIKQKYDPYDLFWVLKGVGTEGWAVRTPTGLPTENGKLCKV